MSASHTTIHQVYAPGFKSVLNIPAHAIHHLPPSSLNVTRLVLCANYDAVAPQTSCPMGDRCKFVHADTRAAKEHSIHVNYAWRSLEDVTYERFPAGQVLRVAPPNSKAASDVMDSDLALKTNALTSSRRPMSHCAHYYFNRTCNLGAECQFVHAVFIDPTAKPHQRAPVPSKLGEGRELQLSKKQREASRGSVQPSLSDSFNSYAVAGHLPQQLSAASIGSESPAQSVTPRRAAVAPALTSEKLLLRCGGAALALRPRSPSGSSSCGCGSQCDCDSNCQCCSTNSARSATNPRVARYRHDPYSFNSHRVVLVSAACF